MLRRIFSLVLSVYPQRSGPHGSTRTLPLFSSVAHTPIGVAAAGAAGAAVAGAAAAGVAAAGADRVLEPTPAIESGGGSRCGGRGGGGRRSGIRRRRIGAFGDVVVVIEMFRFETLEVEPGVGKT